ncbi:trigger factor [Gloeomargarita lithophora Alchichica-D10]|uniref:Trigger factor n=1 Tax=Gloeomargarita lithophora Alchichica-D10 TaxID=1188229 RepID=A0A1J0ABV9_9CYAN|nr:trigger factor [Gloeomargarita lithophora]APB33418.1 trigger factor [Gloeomargarita lithophora Alchichica-D10]
MKITQESLPKSQLGLRVEIPTEEVAKRHEQVFKKILKNVRLPGFRQGKVPPHILRQYVGDSSIRASVVEELLETTMPQALQHIEVPTIGEPQLCDEMETLVQNYQPQQPFVFQIAIDVWPEVTLGDYQNLPIRAAKYEFDPAEVEDILQEHQMRRATLVPVERPAQAGDVAIIDLDAYRQTEQGRGEPASEFESRDMQVDIDLEAGEFYPEVIEALVGMQVGETKEVLLVTSNEFWEGDMVGQTFILELTLKELKEPELPELDDLFAQAVSDCETMEELRTFLTERQQKQATDQTQNGVEQALTDALLEITTTEVPHTLVERNLTELFNDVLNGFVRRGIEAKELNTWLTEARVQEIGQELLPVAVRQVKRVLALKAIAERENFTPDPEEITAGLALAQRTEATANLTRTELEQVVKESLRLKMAMAWLEERAQITWVSPAEFAEEIAPTEAVAEPSSEAMVVTPVASEAVAEPSSEAMVVIPVASEAVATPGESEA